jgi:hypothetical protein
MPWRWDRAKESLSEEFEAHLQIAIAERVDRGEDPAQARAAAMRELGNVPHTRIHGDRPAHAGLGIGANLGVFQLLIA